MIRSLPTIAHPIDAPGFSNECSSWVSSRSPRNTNAYVPFLVPKSSRYSRGRVLFSRTHASAVPVLSRPAYLRTTARRKMAPGLSGRLPLRTLPTFDGLSLPPHARRRQSPARALPSHLPNDRQGVHSYTYVRRIDDTLLSCVRSFSLKRVFAHPTVFDRMFSLGVRGSGTDTAPLGARVAAVAGMASATLPRRHFLYCSLRPENPVPPRGQRHRRRVTGS